MTRAYIDTNIFCDVLLDRKQFIYGSGNILEMCADGMLKGISSSSSILNLLFIIKKIKGTVTAKRDIKNLLQLIQVVPVNEAIISSAIESDFSDTEDAVQYHCAIESDSKFIITRNKHDFRKSRIPVYTPEEFLERKKRK